MPTDVMRVLAGKTVKRRIFMAGNRIIVVLEALEEAGDRDDELADAPSQDDPREAPPLS